MTDTRFSPVDAPEREAVKEPPKRWRNWWRVNQDFISAHSGKRKVVGEEYAAPRAWPSREIAEQKARDTIETRRGYLGGEIRRAMDTYLGAFPEGVAP